MFVCLYIYIFRCYIYLDAIYIYTYIYYIYMFYIVQKCHQNPMISCPKIILISCRLADEHQRLLGVPLGRMADPMGCHPKKHWDAMRNTQGFNGDLMGS